MRERDRWNGARWDQADARGHYESWFQRANHPTRPLAFWIRYTLFAPRAPESSSARPIGELWAITFDGERDRVVALSGLLTARVLGVDMPRASNGNTLFEEYDRLMETHGRRTEFTC